MTRSKLEYLMDFIGSERSNIIRGNVSDFDALSSYDNVLIMFHAILEHLQENTLAEQSKGAEK